jgi:hypothetical protein
MKRLFSGISTTLLLLATPLHSAASAAPATATGSAALAVAAVVAPYSPQLSRGEKKVIAGLFDGNTYAHHAKMKLSVSADAIQCKIGNVDITARSCELTFKKAKHSLKGRAANEVYATLAAAGVASEGAAGSMIQAISKLTCTVDPVVIKDKSGGGADCSFETGE